MEGRPPKERELALRAQRGDEHAFAELVRGQWEIAFRVAMLTTGDAAEAEDAAQEAVAKAWRALARFDPDRPFRPWLLRIVGNEARNRRRSVGRRLRLASLVAAATPSGDAAPSPESTIVVEDERRRLLAELDALPDGARAVLTCRYLLDLSEEETAAALRLRRGTVKSRTARALGRLREIHDRA